MLWSRDGSCWVITYHLNNLGAPVIHTTDTRWEALTNILPKLIEKLKTTYPKVKWEEINLDKLRNTRITEYGIVAVGNPNLYLKVFRSDFICAEELDEEEEEDEEE